MGLGPEAVCLSCHQGRASGDALDAQFADEGLSASDDSVDPDLGFTNVHYDPAGVTLYAGTVRGAYQYAGQVYDTRFRHVSGRDTCVECHDPHSLQLDVAGCAACHVGVETVEDLRDIRMIASASRDYDGDGDTAEGLGREIEGLRAALLEQLQAYMREIGSPAVCYQSGSYPYFFVDADESGTCDDAEAVRDQGYAAWSPRGLAAAYNLHLATQDPGNFAHNAKYTIQVLHDSLQDLNLGRTIPADLSAFDRQDPGHFDGAGEAARHWDENEAVSSSCSRCHGGAPGIAFFLEYGTGLRSLEPDNGLECETCHTGLPDFHVLRPVASVTFPSGVTVTPTSASSSLCMTCHQGRASGAGVEAAIARGAPTFLNVHYGAAGAVKYGSVAAVGLEYPGRDYAGVRDDHPGGSECVHCHDPVGSSHTFAVADVFDEQCVACHLDASALGSIRNLLTHGVDHDGDGSATEPLSGELDGLADRLLAAMQEQAAICHGTEQYPYFFQDTDEDGACSAAEATFANAFRAWTGPLARAAFNLQLARKDPGAWAHNFDYVAQLLIDGIDDLGGDLDGTSRP